jgi:hypothetical protein
VKLAMFTSFPNFIMLKSFCYTISFKVFTFFNLYISWLRHDLNFSANWMEFMMLIWELDSDTREIERTFHFHCVGVRL